MAFLIILTSLLLALNSVMGSPTSKIRKSLGPWVDTKQGLVVHNTGYQGDGLYQAIFNDAGVATVNFTAIDYLNFTIPQAQPTADHEPSGNKTGVKIPVVSPIEPPDHEVICDERRCSNNEGDLQQAMGFLAGHVGTAHQAPQRWFWVWHAGHTAFMCVYTPGTVSEGWVYYYNTEMNNYCGPTCYGYTRGYKVKEGVFDFSVGRTNDGGEFCAHKYTGHPR